MQLSSINSRIRYEFKLIQKVLAHFCLSFIEFLSAVAILVLQILFIINKTCPYHIAVGFWSMPFLLLCPISIWIVIWRRNSISCSISIFIHIIGTLVSTLIILLSFLTLINRIECLTLSSNSNSYFILLNSSMIGIVGFFKILVYSQIIILCKLRRNTEQIPTIFNKDIYQYNHDSPLLLNYSQVNSWHSSWTTSSGETNAEFDYIFF